jgi:hypothetical protein
MYQSGVGKLLHMLQWTRNEITNIVRELSQFSGRALQLHVMAMYQVMKYCQSTPEIGLFLKSTVRQDGSPKMLFKITRYSDLDCQSVSGWSTFLFGVPISMKSKMIPVMALLITEAK